MLPAWGSLPLSLCMGCSLRSRFPTASAWLTCKHLPSAVYSRASPLRSPPRRPCVGLYPPRDVLCILSSPLDGEHLQGRQDSFLIVCLQPRAQGCQPDPTPASEPSAEPGSSHLPRPTFHSALRSSPQDTGAATSKSKLSVPKPLPKLFCSPLCPCGAFPPSFPGQF